MAITITPTVGSTCTVGSTATIAITGLTAGNKYAVAKTDPGGSVHTINLVADVSGNITTAWQPSTSGTLSVSVYPITELAQTGTPPQSTFPSMRSPALLIGTAALATPVTFTVISGE